MEPIQEGFRYGCLEALKDEDAPLMLEWMHDENVASVFQADFASMELEDVKSFIVESRKSSSSLHFAIVNDGREYMGTVSLKRVDESNDSAEYAISMRSAAHGTGLAMRATKDILRYAFYELGLHRVFLDVRSNNVRARRFYDKVGFVHEGTARDGLRMPNGYCDLERYSMLSEEFDREPM